MKKLLFIYIMLTKKYSVMHLKGDDGRQYWAACDAVMEFDYGHNGNWADGASPEEACIKLWRENRS